MIVALLTVLMVMMICHLLCELSSFVGGVVRYYLTEAAISVTQFVVTLFCPKGKRPHVSYWAMAEVPKKAVDALFDFVVSEAETDDILSALDISIELLERDKNKTLSDTVAIGVRDIFRGTLGERLIALCWVVMFPIVWLISGSKITATRRPYVDTSKDPEDDVVGAIVEIIYIYAFNCEQIAPIVAKLQETRENINRRMVLETKKRARKHDE